MECTEEAESAPDSYRVKRVGYMGSLNSVSHEVFTGTYPWFNRSVKF